MVTLVSLNACAWDPWIPDDPTDSTATEPLPVTADLMPGDRRDDSLDCPSGDCQARYRIRIPAAGQLNVVLKPSFSGPQVNLRAFLKDPVGRILDTEHIFEESVIELSGPATGGFCSVLVQAIGGRVDFHLAVDLAATGHD
jgi:hypothetical protein